MDVLHFIGIKIDDDNDPELESVPEHQKQQQGNVQEGGNIMWKSKGIIYPRKAKNIQN